MQYEIWDSRDGNCLGMYPSEAEALAAIADLAREYGPRSREVRTLGLLGPGGPGEKRLIAKGARLVARAQATVSGASDRPRRRRAVA